MKSVNHLKGLLVSHEKQCRHRHTLIAKDHFKGMSNIKIAEKHGVVPTTVSSVLRRKEIAYLVSLLRHYSALWDGPTIQERKRELWEMAVDNKKNDPRVSIAAHKELSAMDGVYKQDIAPKVEITINAVAFPQNKLDEA